MLRKFRREKRDAAGGRDQLLGAAVRSPGSSVRLRDRVRRSSHELLTRLLPILSVALLAALVVVPIGLFIWFLFFTDVFVVQAVTVVDAREQTLIDTKRIIGEGIADIPLNRNIFLIDTEQLETQVAGQLPQVRTVHITRKLPGTIKAIVQEKEPAVLLLSAGKYYFVDDGGVAYEEARLDTLPGVVLPTVKNDDQGSTVRLGVAVADQTFVSFVKTLVELVPEVTRSQVVETHIPSLAAREVHLFLDTNWRIFFDATRSPEAQVEVLAKLLSGTVEEDEAGRLEYVDLRIPNRVYYKLVGDES